MSAYERIYEVVSRIPHGRVATYGQVAAIAGLAGHARQVGYALHALPGPTDVPWHRVVNAQGRLSLRRSGLGSELEQRFRLETEGVQFDASGKLRLDRFGWRPGDAVEPQARGSRQAKARSARGRKRSERTPDKRH